MSVGWFFGLLGPHAGEERQEVRARVSQAPDFLAFCCCGGFELGWLRALLGNGVPASVAIGCSALSWRSIVEATGSIAPLGPFLLDREL